jgi:molybdopterin converting factor small subunit
MQVNVQMFGAFRVLGDCLELTLPDNAKVLDLRQSMQKQVCQFELTNLLGLSKFADDKSVLTDTDSCQENQVLAILPPVSGG